MVAPLINSIWRSTTTSIRLRVICITNRLSKSDVPQEFESQVVLKYANEFVSIPLSSWPMTLVPHVRNAVRVRVREYPIWSEGFACTGENGKAQYLGKFKGETFAAACEAWANSTDDPNYFDKEQLTYWGCRLYDNKEDASKSFG